MLALEQTLFDPIASLDVSAFGTSLRGVTGIDKVNQTSGIGGFVSQKGLKLEERPAVDQKALFLSELFAAVSDVFQVFKCKRGSRRKAVYNPFGDCVVHVSPETVLLRAQFLKVSFGRARTLGLQYLSQIPVPINNVFYMPSSKELVGGSDGDFIDSSIDAHNNARGLSISNIFFKDDSKKDFLATDEEFSGFSSPIFVLLEIGWCLETEILPARNGRDGECIFVKPNIVGPVVVSDTGLFGDRTGCFLTFLYSGFDALQCLGCFVSGGAGELRRQQGLAVLVGFSVE